MREPGSAFGAVSAFPGPARSLLGRSRAPPHHGSDVLVWRLRAGHSMAGMRRMFPRPRPLGHVPGFPASSGRRPAGDGIPQQAAEP